MQRNPFEDDFKSRNQQETYLRLMINISYWRWLKNYARALYSAKLASQKISNKFESLRQGAVNLKIDLQQKFYLWLFRTVKQVSLQDSSTFYEVLSSNSPNPLSSPVTMDVAGAGSIILRGLRLLSIPLQKLMQYYVWKLAPEGSTAMVEKPRLSRQDAFYIGLDIVLLGLTAAAFFVGAPIPAAAIALTAAVISAGVATYHYAKYIYKGYQLKKEKDQVDSLLAKFDDVKRDPLLNESEHALLNKQRAIVESEHPERNFTDRELLITRSETLGEKIKAGINSRYQKVRQTLGFGLTMLSIVAVSLVLGGAVLGPVGVPLIMAGVALGVVASGIAIGMMVANSIKKSRDRKQAELGRGSDIIVMQRDIQEDFRPSQQLTTLYKQSSSSNQKRAPVKSTALKTIKPVNQSSVLNWSPQKQINANKQPVNDDTFQTNDHDKTPGKK